MRGAPLDANPPGASYLSQPRTFTQENTFGNLAQLKGSTRLKTSRASKNFAASAPMATLQVGLAQRNPTWRIAEPGS